MKLDKTETLRTKYVTSWFGNSKTGRYTVTVC